MAGLPRYIYSILTPMHGVFSYIYPLNYINILYRLNRHYIESLGTRYLDPLSFDSDGF